MKDALKTFLKTATAAVKATYWPDADTNERNKAIATALDGVTNGSRIATAIEIAIGAAKGSIAGLVSAGSTLVTYARGAVVFAKDEADGHGYPRNTALVCGDPDKEKFYYIGSSGVTKTDGALTKRRRHVRMATPEQIDEFINALTDEQVAKLANNIGVVFVTPPTA